MITTKLRIDISQGIIEVEGNKTFVLSSYNDYKEKITKLNSPKNNSNTIDEPTIKAATKKQNAKSESSKPKRKGTSQALSLDKDLDLSGKISGESLKSFYNNYNVKSNFDKNLIFN